MIPAFVEGVANIGLPCSLVLIVPVLAVALVVPTRPLIAVAVATMGSTVAIWLRGSGFVSGRLEAWGSVVLAVSSITVIVLWLRNGVWRNRYVVASALVPGLLAGWMWQPCVGAELGSILTAVGERDASSLPTLTAYIVGVVSPAVVVALARVASGDPERLRRARIVSGAALGCLLAGLVVVGLDDRVIGWLVRVSA